MDAEGEILVPLPLKGGLIIRAEEGANLQEVIKRWSQQRLHPHAEVEADNFAITKVGAEAVNFTSNGATESRLLCDLLEGQAQAGMVTVKFDVLRASITD